MNEGMTLSDWTGLITAVGISGSLGLSLYTWFRHIRPSRRVEYELSEKRDTIRVTFINERGPDVVLREVGFEYVDGTLRPRHPATVSGPIRDKYQRPVDMRLYLQLPLSVPAGESLNFYFTLAGWRSDIGKGHPLPVRAYCRDATRKLYKSPNLRWEATCAMRGDDST